MNKSHKIIALGLLFLASPAALQAAAQTAFERPPWAGFFTKCKDQMIDTKRFPFITGEADRVQWADMEPEPGVYDWSKMDAHIRNAVKGRYYPKFGSWRFGIGVEVACGMVDGTKNLV